MNLVPEKLKRSLSARQLADRLDELAVADAIARPLEIIDPLGTQFDDVQPAVYYRSTPVRAAPPPGEELSVMTWNIKFGGGRIDFWYDGHGDRVVMRRPEVLEHLDGIAAAIRRIDPDVVLLQEVDVDSRRTCHVDQVQWLLDETALNFGAYASQWRCAFVPTRGLGKVDMGIAVLSKYPVGDAQRLALPQMRAVDGITRYFYLKRAVLTARIALPEAPAVHAVNVHTEAFSVDDTRKVHIERFKAELDRIHEAGGLLVAGGDLNTLPPETEKLDGFRDIAADAPFADGRPDFAEEQDWLAPLYESYRAAVPLRDYRRDHRPYYTFSSTDDVDWCRKLDYLFTNGEFCDATTHQARDKGGVETMPLSDHAPVSARLNLQRS